MKTSTFKRAVYIRSAPSMPGRITGGRVVRADGMALVQPKDQPVRSEPYRRLVAALPCKACGIQGFSQAAHLPPNGKSIKQDDRLTFALCCDRLGIKGCHPKYDQYELFTRAVAMTVGRAWAADTQRQIIASGQWPKGLEFMSEINAQRKQSLTE